MTERLRSGELASLGDEFFDIQNAADPLSTSLLGVGGYDHLLPDPSREGSRLVAARLRDLQRRVEVLATQLVNEADQIDAAVLTRLTWGARVDLEEGIWEASASSEGYASPSAMVFMCVPSVTINSDVAADAYLTRLSGLGDFFDAVTSRFERAQEDGRHSTRAGLTRSLDQLRGHLALPIDLDLLANPVLAGDADLSRFLAQTRDVVSSSVRPAIERLVGFMSGEMSDLARDDEHVGLLHVPNGDASYHLAVRRHTTTDLSPAEIHQIGLARIESLNSELAELGGRVLHERDVPRVLARLRDDRSLRFNTSQEIVQVARDCLQRAEATRDLWFPSYRVAPCVVEEVHPVEARNSALAHYRPPTSDGSRPGAHCILTLDPGERFRYEYEALSFHESTPGHHLQIATAQTLDGLPTYRRFLDTQVAAFVEGWGLYSERLADEMGLYSSDLARLGMLSFDALRACRLVVDTGMHHLGWSRRRAMSYMWQNTATTAANVANEIDRYIGWPGQALAYMIGAREIERLRTFATSRLGDAFDVREFHGVVLGNGAVPLDVLELLVTRWIDGHDGIAPTRHRTTRTHHSRGEP